jgi:FkbM family methyltransferase
LTGSFYEAEELAALAAFVPRGAVIADVGANLGNHAVYFLRAFAPAELHLFEPNPACVAALQDNFAQNPTDGTEAMIHKCGIGAARGELFFNRHDDLNNGLVPVASGHAERVPIEPLDDMIQRADFLKIDVEGMELDVLAGAERIVRESRPVLFVEVQSRNREAFATWLAAHGYIARRTFPGGDYDNVIATPAKFAGPAGDTTTASEKKHLTP